MHHWPIECRTVLSSPGGEGEIVQRSRRKSLGSQEAPRLGGHYTRVKSCGLVRRRKGVVRRATPKGFVDSDGCAACMGVLLAWLKGR
jgi:hypothetical protein